MVQSFSGSADRFAWLTIAPANHTYHMVSDGVCQRPLRLDLVVAGIAARFVRSYHSRQEALTRCLAFAGLQQ
jgi:hypothetical protein